MRNTKNLTKLPVKETDITKLITDWIDWHGGYWVKQRGGIGCRKGVPDLLVGYKGKFYGFEVKKPGGTTSYEQKEEIRKIRLSGCRAFAVCSLEEVVKELEG